MQDVTVLAEQLSDSYLAFLREKEDFFEFECDSYRLGFEVIAAAMSRALERFDDELHNAKPLGWKVREKAWREPMSEVGQLSFRRRVYIDDVGDRRCMLDEVLDLPKGVHITPAAFDKLTGFGIQTSYHATARLFNRHIEGGITAQSAMNALRTSAGLLKSEAEKKAKSLFDEGVVPDAETAEREVSALRGKKDQTEALRILYREGVDALVEYLEAVPASQANASMSQAIEYLRRHGDDIDPRGPSMGTMESTNAHVIGSRMKAVGGAWSREGGNAMARARAHVANGGRLPRPHSQVEPDHKTRWWYFWEAWRMDNAGPGAADFPETVGSGEQERILSWHADSRQARERFESAIAYDTPRLVPAPFDPMVKLRCHASRTHARPDDLGRNRLQPR